MPDIYVSINKHIIAKNARHGTKEPPISIRKTKSGKAKYVQSVKISGPCELIYSPDKPILKCGARLVLITKDAFVNV